MVEDLKKVCKKQLKWFENLYYQTNDRYSMLENIWI